jgi:surfeit locus 1 family protein
VEGNLHWPEEVDGFTPAPDARTGLWFARDVPAMAEALGSEPVLIVARSPTAPGIEPLPVDTSHIPNDHLGYAVQWFGLAAVWLGMTAYLLWRIRRRTV